MKKINLQKGFTLVETLVAISVLVLAITGAFSAAQGGISSYIFSKDQTISFYLAQESVEQIRNLRDENGLKGNNWLSGIASGPADPCYFGKSCVTDAYLNTVTVCPAGGCPILNQDLTANSPSYGFYGYTSSWTPTIYNRQVTLTSVSADEVSILVTITWTKGFVNRQYKIRENIFNWH